MLRIRSAQVAAAIESVEGSKETLAAADAVTAYEPDFEPEIEPAERDPVRQNLSPWPSVFGKRSARLRFNADLVGMADAGVAHELSAVLKACGVGEDVVAGTSATYSPATAVVPSVTAALFQDGVVYELWGARGEASLLLEAGRPGRWSFDLQGADFDKADAELLSGVSLNEVKPPTFQGANLVIGTYSAVVQSVQITFGNTLALRESASADSGNLSCLITGRRPILSFNPEDVLTTEHDFIGKWKSGEVLAFSCSLGSETGNTIAISAPAVQYQGIRRTNRNGVAVLEVEGLCCGSAGDDEWEIQIT